MRDSFGRSSGEKIPTVKPRVQTSIQVLEHINPEKKVRVYRNLHQKCLSIKQGIVRCHADNVVLWDFVTIVNPAGQRRVREEKRKNVHAYIEGYVIPAQEAWKNRLDLPWQELYYNPYLTDWWVEKETGRKVVFGRFCDVAPESVMAFDFLYGV